MEVFLAFIRAYHMKIAMGIIGGLVFGLLLPPSIRHIVKMKNRKFGRENAPEVMTEYGQGLKIAFSDILPCIAAALFMTPHLCLMCILMVQMCMVCIYTDFNIRVIPNECVILLFFEAIGFRYFDGGAESFLGGLAAMAVMGALFGLAAFIMKATRGTPGVGAGDLKYALVLAFAAGWPRVLCFIGAMVGMMVIFSVCGLITKKVKMNSYYAMCLHISVGFWMSTYIPAGAKFFQSVNLG